MFFTLGGMSNEDAWTHIGTCSDVIHEHPLHELHPWSNEVMQLQVNEFCVSFTVWRVFWLSSSHLFGSFVDHLRG